MDDFAFPRGGRTTTSTKPEEEESTKQDRKKKRKAEETTSPDFLFGSKPETKTTGTKKTKKSSSTATTDAVTTTTTTSSKKSLLPLGGGGVVIPPKGKGTAPIIEALAFSKLSKGTKVLGCVREVQDEFAVLALPNLLTGFMLPTKETSLKQCLNVGQLLTVTIQKVATEQLPGGVSKKRIQVSALPTHVNPRDGPQTILRGQIISVEDHGCLVDLGFGRRGFVKFEEVEGPYEILEAGETSDTNARILQPGRLFDFVPGKTDTTTTVIPLSLPLMSTLAQQVITPPSTKHSATYTLGSLLPGMMVTAKVESLAKNGLCVTFLGNVFRGAIELGCHLGGHEFRLDEKESLETSWRKVFDQHQHFPARIIAIDVPTKLIRLSIAPHVLTMKPNMDGPQVGTILNDCTVVRVDQGIGALLALPEEYHKTYFPLPKKMKNKSDLFQNETFQKAMEIPAIYVHISKAYDETGKKKDSRNEVNAGQFAKDFSLGSKHSVRVLNTGHWMDGVASGGSSPAILQAHVLTHADLQPGQLYKQVPVCAKLSGGSILVNLGGSPGNPVRGLIPSPLHLMDAPAKSSSDFRKKVIDTKFAVDAKVDVRVLWVDQEKKKCVVTAKKSLVKCDADQVVTSYQDLRVGQTATGFVSKLDDRAVYITFCNRVYGKVTAKSLASELGIENHKENYQIGDVVTCRVVKISQTTKRPRDLDDEEDEEMNEIDSNTKVFYQILLSLKIQDPTMIENAIDEDDDDTPKEPLEAKEPKKVHIKAGAILPEKSMKIVELFKGKQRGKHFVPGYAIVSVKSKYLMDMSGGSKTLPQIECKLPFDQLLDDYEPEDIESPEALDALATSVLRVGKKINQKAIVLSDPQKTDVDHASGIGKLTVISLRKSLIATIEGADEDSEGSILLPSPTTHLYVGALVKGYIAQVDPRHGAFLRFLDGMTGLIPRMNGGLNLTPYSTLVAKVQVIDDTVRPFRIMLQPIDGVIKEKRELPVKVGDTIAKAQVKGIQFLEATLEVLDESGKDLKNLKVRIHASMKEGKNAKLQLRNGQVKKNHFVKGHPFFGMKTNDILKNLTVVWIGQQKGKVVVHVTDRKMHSDNDTSTTPTFVNSRSQLKAGMTVKVVVSDIREKNKGLKVMVSPKVQGYIPGLELSTNLDVLNNMASYVPKGARLTCVVMDDMQWHENRAKSPFASRTQKSWTERKSTPEDKRSLYLSVLAVTEPTLAMEKPSRNDLIIGRINRRLPQYQAPALMLVLRGGFIARCCITEMAESDDWENMPLGRPKDPTVSDEGTKKKSQKDDMDVDDDEASASSSSESDEDEQDDEEIEDTFQDGKYVQCRVLKSVPKQSLVEVSLRASRLEGDLEDDETPPEGETVQAYVVETNKLGCFVRLARHIEGRATLTELCDGYLHDPKTSFPPGRLVVGKVKAVNPLEKKSKSPQNLARVKVDLDMRESTILDTKKALTYEDIQVEGKYKGTVTRVESYGVFVQIVNSKVSGLVHLSECSDKFVKNLATLYNPGDLVKVLVIKKDDEEKKIGFSMKASHFEDDDDSDGDSSVEAMDDEDDDDGDDMSDVEKLIESAKHKEDDLDSDDENFVGKLAAKMEENNDKEDMQSDDEVDSQASESSDSDSEDDEEEAPALDTNVGFDWEFKGTSQTTKKKSKEEQSSDESESSDSESDEDDENDPGKRSSHKSRKKQAQRRREEQEISRRETALADGTAEENPETAGDFERLLAGNPNSSELWIRYMAFYLSLADIPAARLVADKALDRIEFREEREKLNVWTALLTLEHKYGNEETLQKTIDRACSQNNPKQVYLRVCEILEKDLTTPDNVTRADAMYSKMCSKFKSKKKVWLAHLSYLLKQSRHEEAHALLKRALLSLAPYKHAETMSRFAQLEFEFGSQERARTLFDGIISKYPKRLDLFFVYVDKEVKFGSLETARSLLENKVVHNKMTDKQVKSIFKKWYRIEEQHGTEESMEHVKEAARKYVQRS